MVLAPASFSFGTQPKFGRNYLLTVQGSQNRGKEYGITMPLTIEFDINRNTFATANTGTFRIYNLNKDTRADLYHTRYDIDNLHYQKIEMLAGYNTTGNLYGIFAGNVMMARSFREGPDWVTEIEAFDGGAGILNGLISITLPKNCTAEQLFREVARSMPFTQFGDVRGIEFTNTREVSMIGSAYDVVQRMLGDKAQIFVDMNNLYGLNENGDALVRPGSIDIILGPNNILGSPVREGKIITVTSVFEPGAFIGQAVTLKSLDGSYDGTYQVRGIHHKGTISEAVCEKATTEFSLYINGLGSSGGA